MSTPQNYLLLSVVLFGIGIAVVLTRRHRTVVLLGIQLMFQAVNLALAALTSGFQDWEGRIVVLALISIAMVELVAGLAAIVAQNREHTTGKLPVQRG